MRRSKFFTLYNLCAHRQCHCAKRIVLHSLLFGTHFVVCVFICSVFCRLRYRFIIIFYFGFLFFFCLHVEFFLVAMILPIFMPQTRPTKAEWIAFTTNVCISTRRCRTIFRTTECALLNIQVAGKHFQCVDFSSDRFFVCRIVYTRQTWPKTIEFRYTST